MTTRDLVLVALFAALMAVLGAFPPLILPAIGIPITAQSMGPMIMGGVLGARRGTLSMLLFLVLVAIGLPLLSGGRGGLAPFAGPWSGFLYGWIVAAFAIGYVTDRLWVRLNAIAAFAICVLGGVVLLYLIGVPWYAVASGMPLDRAFVASALVFLPGDLVKATVAAAIIVAARRAYPSIRPVAA